MPTSQGVNNFDFLYYNDYNNKFDGACAIYPSAVNQYLVKYMVVLTNLNGPSIIVIKELTYFIYIL